MPLPIAAGVILFVALFLSKPRNTNITHSQHLSYSYKADGPDIPVPNVSLNFVQNTSCQQKRLGST